MVEVLVIAPAVPETPEGVNTIKVWCIERPVSAYRQVTTPSNGATIREYSDRAA